MGEFDLERDSLVYLFMLKVILQKNQINNWEEAFNLTRTFLINFNAEQIRKSPDTLSLLSQFLVQELLQRRTPMIGIHPLLQAIGKLQENEKCLTALHSDVCKLSLVSKCFHPVKKILDATYVDIDKHVVDNPERILSFFYYGGMIYASLKQYEKALYYFESCVTMPASVVSYIMLESYKKFILITLLVHGDKTKACLVLPKYTSEVIEKYMKPICKPYHELANAFYSNNSTDLNGVIGKNYDAFEADANTGLVTQVAMAQIKSNIKRLTKTFVTLSLEDVATKAGLGSPKEAKEKIVSMIQERSIHAKVSEKDGMVQFLGNPGKFNSTKELARLEERVDAIILSNKEVKKLEEEIILSTKYIQKNSTRSDDMNISNGFGMNGSLGFEDNGEYDFEGTNEHVSSNVKATSSTSSASPSSSNPTSKYGGSSAKQGAQSSQSAVSSSSNMNEVDSLEG